MTIKFFISKDWYLTVFSYTFTLFFSPYSLINLFNKHLLSKYGLRTQEEYKKSLTFKSQTLNGKTEM